MIVKTLEEIANIALGYTMQKAVSRQCVDGFGVLRTADLSDGLYFSNTDANQLRKIDEVVVPSNAILHPGDIVVAAKSTQGARIHANVFKKEAGKDIIATSSLFIVRVHDDADFLPEYIVLCLNSNEGQKQLKKIITQGTIQSLSIKDFRKLKIPYRPLEEQKKMVDLAITIDQQKILLQRKIALQDMIIKNVISII